MLQSTPAVALLQQRKGHFVVDDTIGTALLVGAAFQHHPENYLIITTNLYNAQQVVDFLAPLVGEDQIGFFPMDELLRSESVAASKEMMAQRLFVMSELMNKKPKIIVCNVAAALRYLPSPKLFASKTASLQVGQSYSITQLSQQLATGGYTRVNKIDQTLQFALRGDIVDIYSVNLPAPIRIEFFDEEIESIRYFDIATQTSYQELNNITIMPASDIMFDDKQLAELPTSIRAQALKDQRHLSDLSKERLQFKINDDIERIEQKDYHSSLYKYMGFAGDIAYSIVDFIDNPTVIIANQEQFEINAKLVLEESLRYLLELQENGDTISHLAIYQETNKVLSRAAACISFSELRKKDTDIYFPVRPIIGQSTNVAGAINLIESYRKQGSQVVVALNNPNQKKLLLDGFIEQSIQYEELAGLNLPTQALGVTLFNLERGFELLEPKVVFLTARELLNFKNQSSRFISRFREATILRSYEDLQPGDYVVHEFYGIGQFVDVETLLVDELHRDYLHINFAAGDVLYVPLAQFRLVRKYLGREGAAPRLNRLNSNDWEKTKKKIKSRVKDIAEELVKLYSLRAKKEGFAFPSDDEFQISFEEQFPYELTVDQRQSLAEIKRDMEKPEPMDRLLCGDVGFGKTEMAFRAAFKAISAGKQTAILCPTTLLARQHYEVAKERFASFGIKIALLSRLVPESQQKVAIEKINEGKIDLIIGTHRLLSKEITYPHLGLLVIDEEQRFGVEQKEKIKSMKINVDVLTLSATPIPRTLQMSMIGIREISQINTAPTSRMPIQTYVMEYRAEVVRELLERELARRGQVFYLHNQVATIYSKARQIQQTLPDARIGIVHGQMDRETIEDVMIRFYQGDIDILVCTSIVENGIDVANANLIIIENADHFGLAQLYQIKGRVGRGDRIAYAYLLYNGEKKMNDLARKRLKSIQDFTELGSGYKIAQRDLMIRGAGDILGAEQAGFIDSVGIDLYLKLLNDAIAEERTGTPPIEEVAAPKSFSVDAYIPTDYANKIDKIDLYKNIAACKTQAELDRFETEIRDIYGRIPAETKMLIRQQALEIMLQSEEFVSVEENKDSIIITLSPNFMRIPRIGTDLFAKINRYQAYLKVRAVGRELTVYLTKPKDWFEMFEGIIREIHVLYLNSKDRQHEN